MGDDFVPPPTVPPCSPWWVLLFLIVVLAEIWVLTHFTHYRISPQSHEGRTVR